MTELEQEYIHRLEQAVLEAECVMADWECARRKGYIRGAQRTVFGTADHIRRVRKQRKTINEGTDHENHLH
jgi:hypothetical protein